MATQINFALAALSIISFSLPFAVEKVEEMVSDPCKGDWVEVARGDWETASEWEAQCRAEDAAYKEWLRSYSDQVADVYGGL